MVLIVNRPKYIYIFHFNIINFFYSRILFVWISYIYINKICLDVYVCVCFTCILSTNLPKHTLTHTHTHTHTHTYIAGKNMKHLWHQTECRIHPPDNRHTDQGTLHRCLPWGSHCSHHQPNINPKEGVKSWLFYSKSENTYSWYIGEAVKRNSQVLSLR